MAELNKNQDEGFLFEISVFQTGERECMRGMNEFITYYQEEGGAWKRSTQMSFITKMWKPEATTKRAGYVGRLCTDPPPPNKLWSNVAIPFIDFCSYSVHEWVTFPLRAFPSPFGIHWEPRRWSVAQLAVSRLCVFLCITYGTLLVTIVAYTLNFE